MKENSEISFCYICITVLFHVAFFILKAIVFVNYECKMIKKKRFITLRMNSTLNKRKKKNKLINMTRFKRLIFF